MLSLPSRLALGFARLIVQLLVSLVRLTFKVAGAAVAATVVMFVLDMVLLGDKRRSPRDVPPVRPAGR